MLKVIGGGLLCLASGYVGIQIEKRYKERAAFYEDFKSYLEFSENRISAFKSPVTEILKEYRNVEKKSKEFSRMISEVEHAFGAAGGREKISAITSKTLKKSDVKLFCDYFKNVGKTSLTDELNLLGAVKNVAAENLKTAKNETEKKGKMYFKLSIVLGLAAMLVVI